MIKVLIVEDNRMMAEVNRNHLEKVKGFLFCGIAATGAEALEILAKQQIDLVLLDIFLPDMNGLEILSKIRQENYSVDVILVSAAQDNKSIQTGLRNGAVDYLIKPFKFERLQAALLGFEKRLELIQKYTNVSQSDLDQEIFSGISSIDIQLPKGLDENTIKRVWDKIRQTNNAFSAGQMADNVGLSPVSMRKYLKHFQNTKLLSTEITYGGIGRPVYKYRCINEK